MKKEKAPLKPKRKEPSGLLEEIIELVREDQNAINAWYRKHPHIPYEWRFRQNVHRLVE
jgi:hypothetical protein